MCAVAFLCLLLLFNGCSTKKNTGLSRGYHNLTAYYNVYFNGVEAFKSGVKKVDEAHKDNYSIILPVFKYSNPEASRAAFGDMNRAIEKGSKCIHKHSITAKPKKKKGNKAKKKKKFDANQTEYVKWIDDSYLLIGKANFYKRDFFPAIETFNYIIKQYSKSPLKHEAYIWLARTYLEMEKYKKAQEFLSMLEADKATMTKDILGPYNITWADLMLKQDKYLEAIPFLEKGVESSLNKKDKVRYYYILAQVYQQIEDNSKAYDAYGKVVEMNPNYEMTFNARINRASIFNSEANDSRGLIKDLTKMLKDDKNIDYRDQIYYALGNIAYNEGRVDDAIELYKLSSKSSTENTNQKAVSFLAIADIYFDEPHYENAQTFYDSAVTFLDNEYPNYIQIKRKSDNLNDLVLNLNVISLEDSLQHVAQMSDNERNILIDKIIAQVIEDEEREKELLAQQQTDLAYLEQTGRQMSSQGGKWYFYNPAMLSNGQSEYKKKWGARKLEDNWRRKNKEEAAFDAYAEEDTETSDSAAVVYSNKSREFYIVDLPLTDSAIQVSKAKVEEAYYNIATIYKNKFYDYPLSVQGYLDLLENYPDTEYELSSFYSLCKLYLLSKEFEKAEEYKAKIIEKYPESDYAKILMNPDYFKELEKIEKQVNFMYQATYKYFLVDKCDDVNRNYKYVDSAYPESKLLPKFDLLSTLCSGTSGDTALFKENLEAFKERHPYTEEATYAKDVLAALDRSPREVELKEEEEVKVDEFADGASLDSIDYSIFKYNDQAEHAFMVVVANEIVDANRIKFNMSNFNIDYYSFLDFEISNILISAKYSAIVVKKFKNKHMASNYYESVYIAGEAFENIDNEGFRTYIISNKNLKEFEKDKNIPKYQLFFEDFYGGLIQK